MPANASSNRANLATPSPNMVNKIGGAGNKWTKESEFDLLMAMLLDDELLSKPNWAKVSSKMQGWGYLYSKSGMQQHWNIMFKSFKERREKGAVPQNNDASPLSTPTPTPSRKVTPTSAKTNTASTATASAGIKRPRSSTKVKRAGKSVMISSDEDSDASDGFEVVTSRKTKRPRVKRDEAKGDAKAAPALSIKKTDTPAPVAEPVAIVKKESVDSMLSTVPGPVADANKAGVAPMTGRVLLEEEEEDRREAGDYSARKIAADALLVLQRSAGHTWDVAEAAEQE